MEKHYFKIDRSSWQRGPWDDEPDRVEWRYEGFPCLILRNEMGTLCGYVGVPAGHLFYGKKWSEPDVSVHGGLTYSGRCQGHICHVPGPGESDDVWWLGFDCAHVWDISPCCSMLDREGSYRDIDYVTKEVESLADQLK